MESLDSSNFSKIFFMSPTKLIRLVFFNQKKKSFLYQNHKNLSLLTLLTIIFDIKCLIQQKIRLGFTY